MLTAAAAADRRLLVLMRTHGHGPLRDRAVMYFSRAGEHGACWVALGGAGLLRDRRDPAQRRKWWRGVRILALAYALNYAVKLSVRRRRPVLEGLPPLSPVVSGLSFPSAHATTSFAAARAYGRLLPARWLYAVASLLALSRPYLGVHYPSDVAAGAVLGTVLAEVVP